MVKRILLSGLLCTLPAWAAPDTTTINWTVVLPNAAPATSGTVMATLSSAGTAPDGGSSSVVVSRTSATIAGNGAVTMALVPNDIITPSGTYYIFHYDVRTPTLASWNEKRSVVTAPDPALISDAPLLDPPTGTATPVSTVQDEGSSLTRRTRLNFTGKAVACSDNTGTGTTDCTVVPNGTIEVNKYATGGSGTQGSPWTSASGTGGLTEAAATCIATGCKLHLSPGYYKLTAMASFGAGVFIEGDDANAAILVADPSFSGASILRWKNPVSDNSFAGTAIPGVGGRNFALNCAGVAAHGIDVFKAYDAVTFDTVTVVDVGDAYNAFRFEPNTAYSGSSVSQTLLMLNTYAIHKNAGATGAVYYFQNMQEMTMVNVKGFGGYATGTGACDVMYFENCRGVTVIGGAVAISTGTGIHVKSTATGYSIGLVFDGVTFEAVGTAMLIEGVTDYVQDVVVRGSRKQEGSVNPPVASTGGFVVQRLNRGYLDVPGFTMTVDANSSDVSGRVANLPDLTSDSGTRTQIYATQDTGHSWTQHAFNGDLGLFPNDSSGPEIHYGHAARTDYWRAFWSAAAGSEFGFQLRYVTTGAVSKRAAIFDSAGGVHLYYNDVDTIVTTATGVTITGNATATSFRASAGSTSTAGQTVWAKASTACSTACTSLLGSGGSCSDSVPMDGTNTPLGNCSSTSGLRLCECY